MLILHTPLSETLPLMSLSLPWRLHFAFKIAARACFVRGDTVTADSQNVPCSVELLEPSAFSCCIGHYYFIIAGCRNKSRLRVEAYCSNCVCVCVCVLNMIWNPDRSFLRAALLPLQYRDHEHLHSLIQTTATLQHLVPPLFVQHMRWVQYKSQYNTIRHNNAKMYSYKKLP